MKISKNEIDRFLFSPHSSEGSTQKNGVFWRFFKVVLSIINNVWDITASAKQGGGVSCIPGFLRKNLLKLRFLSDQEVPGCQKNIYRELRPSFTRSQWKWISILIVTSTGNADVSQTLFGGSQEHNQTQSNL